MLNVATQADIEKPTYRHRGTQCCLVGQAVGVQVGLETVDASTNTRSSLFVDTLMDGDDSSSGSDDDSDIDYEPPVKPMEDDSETDTYSSDDEIDEYVNGD